MMGYLHNLMSKVTFLQLRVILRVRNLPLPYWDTLKRARERIQEDYGMKTQVSTSVWDNKCFTLNLRRILANVSKFSTNIGALVVDLEALLDSRNCQIPM